MTGAMNDLGLAAPCGIYCGDCEHLKTRCSGCGTLAGKPFWTFDLRLEVCPLYACCVIEKGLEHCGLCRELPCETFQQFHDPALTPEEAARSVLVRKLTLLRRRDAGTALWLEERKR